MAAGCLQRSLPAPSVLPTCSGGSSESQRWSKPWQGVVRPRSGSCSLHRASTVESPFHKAGLLSSRQHIAAGLKSTRVKSLGKKRVGSGAIKAQAVAQSEQATAVSSDVQDASQATVTHLFRQPLLSPAATASLLRQVQEKVSSEVEGLETEQCYNIALTGPLDAKQWETLTWLLTETYEPENFGKESQLANGAEGRIVEVGPRLSFQTAWSANAVSICKACGLPQVARIERSRRYHLSPVKGADPLSEEQLAAFAALVHDRMTETVYPTRLTSFETNVVPEPVIEIDVMTHGRRALEEINKRMGLAFDDWDLQYYLKLFKEDIKRNPTNVELFDIAQSNSEHSRHWIFNGELTVDGEPTKDTLFSLVKDTYKANPNNSVIAFKDNSSAIRGYPVDPILPTTPGKPGPLDLQKRDYDVLFTAETHNFPCAVAPFPGAETGAGGRIRDTHATGTGSLVVASTAGYCVGNLQMEGNVAPWEDTDFAYPPNLAPPLQILLDASDGASDYGNKFGEPLIQGYTRTFGMRLPNGERREWLKPIMFSAGIGQIDHRHLEKGESDLGMLVVKIGGPAYRIGMGGGAASSMVSGDNDADLDFNAVQRGDAEMAQKLFRVVKTCVELGGENPIVSIHDQGAGGNCNVVKEIIYPKGAEIDIRKVVVGDHTMSVLEIWGAEYQEQDALLLRPESEALFRSICARERVSMAVIGQIDGSGKVVLVDGKAREEARKEGLPEPRPAVDLDLDKVLGDMPRKKFHFDRRKDSQEALDIAPNVTVADALRRVLRLPAVCSKRFLTSKVDRSVTGLVAQQQTVGALQLPLADVAVIAQTHVGTTGGACAIGEQPLKGLLDPKAMARLALGEALTNLVWAKASALQDVRASGNWMYAAKLPGEGAAMFDAAKALRDAMIELGVAIDGGKDSLSMAAQAGRETVKAPGNLVISAYVTCPDITLTVTPDLKLPGEGVLLHVDLAQGRRRLGGSALAHAFYQIGDKSPDMDDVDLFKRAWNVTQSLVQERKISAGHDVSDGGLVTALLEMAFAGNVGMDVDVPAAADADTEVDERFGALFAEELGLVLEVSSADAETVVAAFEKENVPVTRLGGVTAEKEVKVKVAGVTQVEEGTAALRDLWEETSFALERLQRVETVVEQEEAGLKHRTTPQWQLSFTPTKTPDNVMEQTSKFKVAVVREEGSNGDREMAAAVRAAGFEPWDVSMSDLLAGRASLSDFRGVIFVGGFSYGDVLDSAKGWAGAIRFNPALWQQFQAFYERKDTFSLGVCNGCQLMALLGWVPGGEVGGSQGSGGDETQPRFVHNDSGRFESRFLSVRIEESPAVMLKDMAGTNMGIWISHGEGKALFPDQSIKDTILRDNLAPIRYSDDAGVATESYPFNPNGSPEGIAALCSSDGRHLALMPHPERSYLMWQLPWVPKEWDLDRAGPSPWLKLWQNAREWCESQS